MIDSRISGLHKLSVAGRLQLLEDLGLISGSHARQLSQGESVLSSRQADKMIENVIGVFALPFAIAPNFKINGRDYIVPLVVEEPSIVAGLSSAAKVFRPLGGFTASADDPVLIGQIQIVDVVDADAAIHALHDRSQLLLDAANERHQKLVARGGGARDLEYFKYQLADGRWTVALHLLVDTRDAMGANIVNSMCEHIAPRVESICAGRVCLRILSNLADRSLVVARGTVALNDLVHHEFAPEAVRDGIVMATEFAEADPYRAATHNKGIMNGIDAVAVATGNDWRSVEAGAHAYAAKDGEYRSLTRWSVTDDGDLQGELTIPLRVGIAGSMQTSNPGAKLGLQICAVRSGVELAELMAAVGLAQNFAALRALVTHGIQKGHMRLHARNLVASAGAAEREFEQVVTELIDSGEIKSWKAEEIVNERRNAARTGSPALPDHAGTGTADGKVILLGEHAAVYDRHVLALPIQSAITATVYSRGNAETLLAVPDWDLYLEWVPGLATQNTAAAVVERITKNFGVITESFEVRVESRIPAAMGLGASAAFAVAVIRAFDDFLDRGLSNAEINELAFECERLAHGTPSGIDNNIATFGQPVLFSRSARTRTKPFTLANSPPLVVASSAIRGNTRDMIAGVRDRYDENTALYNTLFDEMDEMSVAGAVALRNGDWRQLGALMNVCQGYLNAIQVSTPELETMISIARDAGALGAKLTGAGGGGSVVALCPDKVADVARALERAGYRIIPLELDGGKP